MESERRGFAWISFARTESYLFLVASYPLCWRLQGSVWIWHSPISRRTAFDGLDAHIAMQGSRQRLLIDLTFLARIPKTCKKNGSRHTDEITDILFVLKRILDFQCLLLHATWSASILRLECQTYACSTLCRSMKRLTSRPQRMLQNGLPGNIRKSSSYLQSFSSAMQGKRQSCIPAWEVR